MRYARVLIGTRKPESPGIRIINFACIYRTTKMVRASGNSDSAIRQQHSIVPFARVGNQNMKTQSLLRTEIPNLNIISKFIASCDTAGKQYRTISQQGGSMKCSRHCENIRQDGKLLSGGIKQFRIRDHTT